MSTPTTINDGGPAFPVPDVYHPNGEIEYGKPGMSLRAYFAGQALTGELACSGNSNFASDICHAALQANKTIAEQMAYRAVRYADALIAELNKTQQ